MRIGINKDAARHVDAYVSEVNRQKMDKLIQEKGLQGKKGTIGFMDLLPKEETYGYQIEQDSRNQRKQLGYEMEDDSPLENMNRQIDRDNQISKYKSGKGGLDASYEPASEAIAAYDLFTTPHQFTKINKPSAGLSITGGRGQVAHKAVANSSYQPAGGAKIGGSIPATRKKF